MVLNAIIIDFEDAIAPQNRGFSRKLAIHPRQVDPIPNGFRPMVDEIGWANNYLITENDVASEANTIAGEPICVLARQILPFGLPAF